MTFAAQLVRQPCVRIPTARPLTIRPFSAARYLRLKEDKPQDPEELEKTKQEQLRKQERGEGHWHEELASGSESHVKADREEVQDHDKHMKDLQDQTAGESEKQHPHGKAR